MDQLKALIAVDRRMVTRIHEKLLATFEFFGLGKRVIA